MMYTTWFINNEEWQIMLTNTHTKSSLWVAKDSKGNTLATAETIEGIRGRVDTLTNRGMCDRIEVVEELDAAGQGRCC